MIHVVHVLQERLLELGKINGKTQVAKDVKGIGLSDWVGYASLLNNLYTYSNTYYHTDPQLDITNPTNEYVGRNDFLISSDVFEHVIQPRQRAFNGAFKCLSDNGVLVLTVPYRPHGNTTEHFPNLNEFEIIKNEQNKFILKNVTPDGTHEIFENLCFHGGPGSTLEMRVFSLPDIIENLKQAGLHDIRVHDQDFLENGIIIKNRWSLPISAVKVPQQ